METGVAATEPRARPGSARRARPHLERRREHVFAADARTTMPRCTTTSCPRSGSRQGYLHAAWYDFRDAATNCGGSSNIYAARSRDGGVTWDASQRVTSSLPQRESFRADRHQPNAGDYIGLYAGDALALSWGDQRVPQRRSTSMRGGAIVHHAVRRTARPTSTRRRASTCRSCSRSTTRTSCFDLSAELLAHREQLVAGAAGDGKHQPCP